MAAHQAPPSLGLSRQEHWSGLPFLSPMHESEKWKWIAQSCPTFSDPMDCSPPGSSVHGIFQARVLEWGAIANFKTTHWIHTCKTIHCEESWAPKNWCFWTVVLEKTLEGPLDSKEVKPVYPKGNQSWIFIGRTPKLWYFGHLMRRAYSLEKILMLGKTEGRRRRGWQDEMLGCHHWLNRHEFGQAPGVGDGQGSLVCCSQWGHKESDMTEQLNWWRN